MDKEILVTYDFFSDEMVLIIQESNNSSVVYPWHKINYLKVEDKVLMINTESKNYIWNLDIVDLQIPEDMKSYFYL